MLSFLQCQKQKLSCLFILSSLFIFAACSPSSDNALLSDYKSSSECPVTGCVNTSVSSSGLMMSINSSTRSSDGQSKGEVTGRCSPGAYPDNRIAVAITGPGGGTVNPTIVGINGNTSDLKCVDGKFHIAFDTSSFGASQKYRVSLTLMGIRSGSTTPETSGYSQVSFDFNK